MVIGAVFGILFGMLYGFKSTDYMRGIGLGLAIARGLAEARGATLTIDDHDHGCVFALRVPGAMT